MHKSYIIEHIQRNYENLSCLVRLGQKINMQNHLINLKNKEVISNMSYVTPENG